MSIIINPPPTPPSITACIPKYATDTCPFCDCNKEIRYETFNPENGYIIYCTMEIYGYKNLIINNHALPQVKQFYFPTECYCPQCYISFSISKSLGIL